MTEIHPAYLAGRSPLRGNDTIWRTTISTEGRDGVDLKAEIERIAKNIDDPISLDDLARILGARNYMAENGYAKSMPEAAKAPPIIWHLFARFCHDRGITRLPMRIRQSKKPLLASLTPKAQNGQNTDEPRAASVMRALSAPDVLKYSLLVGKTEDPKKPEYGCVFSVQTNEDSDACLFFVHSDSAVPILAVPKATQEDLDLVAKADAEAIEVMKKELKIFEITELVRFDPKNIIVLAEQARKKLLQQNILEATSARCENMSAVQMAVSRDATERLQKPLVRLESVSAGDPAYLKCLQQALGENYTPDDFPGKLKRVSAKLGRTSTRKSDIEPRTTGVVREIKDSARACDLVIIERDINGDLQSCAFIMPETGKVVLINDESSKVVLVLHCGQAIDWRNFIRLTMSELKLLQPDYLTVVENVDEDKGRENLQRALARPNMENGNLLDVMQDRSKKIPPPGSQSRGELLTNDSESRILHSRFERELQGAVLDIANASGLLPEQLIIYCLNDQGRTVGYYVKEVCARYRERTSDTSLTRKEGYSSIYQMTLAVQRQGIPLVDITIRQHIEGKIKERDARIKADPTATEEIRSSASTKDRVGFSLALRDDIAKEIIDEIVMERTIPPDYKNLEDAASQLIQDYAARGLEVRMNQKFVAVNFAGEAAKPEHQSVVPEAIIQRYPPQKKNKYPYYHVALIERVGMALEKFLTEEFHTVNELAVKHGAVLGTIHRLIDIEIKPEPGEVQDKRFLPSANRDSQVVSRRVADQIDSFFNPDLTNLISVEQIAALAHVTPSYIVQRLKRGQSEHQLTRQFRLIGGARGTYYWPRREVLAFLKINE